MDAVLSFFTDPATTDIYTLSLHDALPISTSPSSACASCLMAPTCKFASMPEYRSSTSRSEEHTSELQSLTNLVCRLLLEKKKPRSSTEISRCRRLTTSKN